LSTCTLEKMSDLDEPRSRRDRPAKPPLSRALIVNAALELVKADRLDAVTLRSVAERLDTGPASLYVYVSNREDLLERMLERVLSEVQTIAVEPLHWREQLIDLFTTVLDALSRYPGIAHVALGSLLTWSSALDLVENALALLRAGGIPDQEAAWATDALFLFTVATGVEHSIERVRPPTEPHHKSTSIDYIGNARAVFASLPVNRYPNLSSMATTMTRGDDLERFRFGLNAIISGARSSLDNAIAEGA
jgi:AcrR family transcriptional regulator